jgi:hypothetical protein
MRVTICPADLSTNRTCISICPNTLWHAILQILEQYCNMIEQCVYLSFCCFASFATVL